MKPENQPRPLIVGEVLFDCFPDHCVLGGAPFNVAWNLRGLGMNPLLVSAVGDDEPGRQVRQAMQSWGLDDSALQVDAEHATGRVDITLDSGEPSYRFWEDVAFDHIQPPASLASGEGFGLLYHGSLALRSPESRSTIGQLKRQCGCPVFIDINVRRPYFDTDWIAPLITGAEHVKLNLQELRLLCPDAAAETLLGTGGDAWEPRRQAAIALQNSYRIENVWITAGEQGAGWVGPQGQFDHAPAPPIAAMVDTVGAGDAFAAMIIRGILTGAAPNVSLRQAAHFAARVCGLRGASVADTRFYSQELV